MSIKKAIESNGYAVIKGVIPEESIQIMRRELLGYFKNGDYSYSGGCKIVNNAFNLTGVGGVSYILKNPVIKSCLQQVLGDDFIYVNHSAITCNATAGWHRDSISESQYDLYKNKYSSSDRYALYKVLIYLQDHKNKNYAIKIRKGSHLTEDCYDCDTANVNLSLGDIVIIDLRVMHGGMQEGGSNPWLTSFFHYLIPSKKHIEMSFLRLINNIIGRILTKKSHYHIVAFFRKYIAGKKDDRLLITYSFGLYNDFTKEHMLKHVSEITYGGSNVYDYDYISSLVIEHLSSAGIGYPSEGIYQ